jgi:glycosyltransferase involved in cell wall biosynthesis
MASAFEEERKRILLLNAALFIGGAENVTAALCRGIDRERFEVTVAHLGGRGEVGKALVESGFDVVSLQSERGGVDYLSGLRLRSLLKAKRIDLVHTHDLYSMIDSAVSCKTLPRVRHINTFHFGNYPRRIRRWHLFEKYFSRLPDRLVAVGEVQKGLLVKHYGFRPETVSVIHNGVDDIRAGIDTQMREQVRAGRKIVIGSVGTLIAQKAIADLLDVAYQLKQAGLDFRLVIVGDGKLRASLEEKSIGLGLSRDVEFLGWVPEASRRILPWVDIFVQTSLWEAMSIVVLEAMSCGIPVVVTDVGENPHVISNGVNGFLSKPRAIEDMAGKIGALIQNEASRRQIGAAARDTWESRYTAHRMCRQYEKLYLQTLR